MFEIVILFIFLIFMYFLIRHEKRRLKFILLIYFSVLSIIFLSGLFYISSTYQLSYSPIEDGFRKLFYWVNLFSYFYLIPLFILIVYKLVKYTNKTFNKTWMKIGVLVVGIALLLCIGYVSFFIFILLFYGFGP